MSLRSHRDLDETDRDRQSHRRAALRFADHLAKPIACEKVIAGTAVVNVARACIAREFIREMNSTQSACWTSMLNCRLPSSFLDQRQ